MAKRSLQRHTDIARIRICLEDRTVRTVSVDRRQQIKKLLKVLGPEIRVLVFSGYVLATTQTFEYYGIEDGDFIIALLSKEQEDRALERWFSLTTDKEQFNEAMTWATSTLTNREVGRIQDLRMAKAEMKMWGHGRPFRFANQTAEEPAPTYYEGIIPLTQAKKPSSDALPVFWDKNDDV